MTLTSAYAGVGPLTGDLGLGLRGRRSDMVHNLSRDARGDHVAGTAFSPIVHPTVVVSRKWSAAPIDVRGIVGNAPRMNGSRTSLADDASALLAAATGLHADPSESASVKLLTSTLADVEEALRALSGATHHAADALIPPRRIDESASSRYARAAASWPDHGDGAPPSYERQAQILTELHDAAATLRAGAECCRRARDILASTIA